jgi:hypothetical protein
MADDLFAGIFPSILFLTAYSINICPVSYLIIVDIYYIHRQLNNNHSQESPMLNMYWSLLTMAIRRSIQRCKSIEFYLSCVFLEGFV